MAGRTAGTRYEAKDCWALSTSISPKVVSGFPIPNGQPGGSARVIPRMLGSRVFFAF